MSNNRNKFNEEEFQKFLNDKLSIFDRDLLLIPKGAQGQVLKEKMIELNPYLGEFNCLLDRAKLKEKQQLRFIDSIKALAIKQIFVDPNYSSYTGPAKEKIVEIYKVQLSDDHFTSVNEEKAALEWYSYAVMRFSSTFEDIKNTIMVCVNGLSYDKQELQSMH